MIKRTTRLNLLLVLGLSLVLAVLGLSACSDDADIDASPPAEEATTRIITDALGREVEIPVTVESIITLGSGAPRLAAYLDVVDMLVGAEEYNTEDVVVRRDYNPVHIETFRELPLVGTGGGSGDNNGFPEEIILVSPDVIIAGFDWEAADELQAQTNIPVVSVRHQTGLAHESFAVALHTFAEVVDELERAWELLAYIEDLKADLDGRTRDIDDADKPSVYAGAVTWNGRRGFGGTYSDFGPLVAVNALNVADDADIDGFFEADFEAILVWDPDVIFLDPGNMDLVNDEYRANPGYFDSLRAVQEGRVYTMPAFNFSGTNITYALINAYYAGIVLYPEEFSDIDIEDKAEEILITFLGENTFEIMREDGLFYGKLSIGE
ncbi:MAG: ABC transporter substrate-binding protein [Coriobacteriia bacterium]|nr:ABC transporter substrate-binding protein [Coriobacteriia bacterium]